MFHPTTPAHPSQKCEGCLSFIFNQNHVTSILIPPRRRNVAHGHHTHGTPHPQCPNVTATTHPAFSVSRAHAPPPRHVHTRPLLTLPTSRLRASGPSHSFGTSARISPASHIPVPRTRHDRFQSTEGERRVRGREGNGQQGRARQVTNTPPAHHSASDAPAVPDTGTTGANDAAEQAVGATPTAPSIPQATTAPNHAYPARVAHICAVLGVVVRVGRAPLHAAPVQAIRTVHVGGVRVSAAPSAPLASAQSLSMPCASAQPPFCHHPHRPHPRHQCPPQPDACQVRVGTGHVRTGPVRTAPSMPPPFTPFTSARPAQFHLWHTLLHPS
ncbi:hypothetical protein PLICRDRAFT_178414 [Plicaturopsis crispa FD-325 SS-3]|nr:hypothetical protein PLICRDRAFT_178414 [Plicaturopsis crispa FD-325 SS-3]